MTVTDLSPAPAAAGVTPQEVVDHITSAAKTSFDFGMKLLSRPRREAMRAVYAFCRVVDDIADGDLPVEQKRTLLADWRGEIDRLYDGAPNSAIGQALVGPIQRYDLPKGEFQKMIEGMLMDANGPIVAPSMMMLSQYNRCVAGSVGMVSMRIFGAWRGVVSERFALRLADALQLTNILRDVEEDAGIGRIYLPAGILAEHGIEPDCATIARHPALPLAKIALGARARQSYTEARAEIRNHGRISLAPALAMLGVYEAYLDQMEAAGFANGFEPVQTKREKVRNGLRAVFFAGARK
ncbi:MAG: squalene/phytoene synthase family protein [Pseudomonadota bacterium]